MKEGDRVPDILTFREFEAFINKIILRNAVETFNEEYDQDHEDQISLEDEPDQQMRMFDNRGKPETAEFGCTFSKPQIDVGVQTVEEETARRFYARNDVADQVDKIFWFTRGKIWCLCPK